MNRLDILDILDILSRQVVRYANGRSGRGRHYIEMARTLDFDPDRTDLYEQPAELKRRQRAFFRLVRREPVTRRVASI